MMMSSPQGPMPELNDSEFKLLSNLIYERSGIHLGEQKMALVRARLLKRLRALNLPTFRKYYDYVTRNDASGQEEVQLLNAISTNLTEFFREPKHFDYLTKMFFPKWQDEARIRILSAGCSTGEEPYSIAITAREFFGEAARGKVQIEAGDISTRVLSHAINGIYPARAVKNLPQDLLRSSFLRGTGSCEGLVAIAPMVKELVEFRHLNLMQPFDTQGPYHAIFCRNVAIYFDRETQQDVFQRMSQVLVVGGTLFLGHSESMVSSNRNYAHIQPAVYERRN